jgi:hypothetical protein
MSKKDRRLLIVICIVSSVLLSLVLTEVRLRYSNVAYAKEAWEYSKEAYKAVIALDSTFVNQVENE